MQIETGMLARSLSGHDSGKLYIVVKADGGYVWLSDGRGRTVEKPKKKNQKHIQIAYRIPDAVKEVLGSGRPLQNEHIKQAIQSESQNWQEDKHV